MVHAGILEGKKKQKWVRVARGDSKSNSNLLSAREIFQMHDNSVQCDNAQLKTLTNCFITHCRWKCASKPTPKLAYKEILATRFANVISARHWILWNVTELHCATLLAML